MASELKTVLQKNDDKNSKRKSFSKKKLILIVLLIIFIALFFGFLIKYFLNLQTLISNKNSIIQQQAESEKRKYDEIQALKKEKEALENKRQKEIEEKETEAQTINVEIDKTKISIEVLNGNGVTRAATNFSIVLKEIGYTNIVKVADADNYEYEDVIIKHPKSKKAEADLIKKDLEDKKYKVTEVENIDLDVSDFVVIVGKQL